MARGIQGIPAGDFYAVGATVKEPKLYLTIEKRDNGYVIDLTEPAKKKDRPKPQTVPSEEEINEKLDAMSDGFAAFMKSIFDKATGEEWKEGETKQKIRAAIKAFAPSIASPGEAWQTAVPRMEQCVFEKKADLIKYLEENL